MSAKVRSVDVSQQSAHTGDNGRKAGSWPCQHRKTRNDEGIGGGTKPVAAQERRRREQRSGQEKSG